MLGINFIVDILSYLKAFTQRAAEKTPRTTEEMPVNQIRNEN
ncbi:hypothetical protein ASZ90_003676 [hydrocarbon metagenome]|uniref:Uncharacterized protein n=1 Tax=hydrocarbon metagenome TaxID=938273 RepID=A0A0W8FZZ2_9ZZZZ